MQTTRHLSAEAFETCFAQPMRNVTESAEAVLDIWPYVDSLDLDDLGLPSVNDVHYVYRDAVERFDQILIGTGRFNTLLVVVVDRHLKVVLGHHLYSAAIWEERARQSGWDSCVADKFNLAFRLSLARVH